LQALLDDAVEGYTVQGVTAAVVLAGSGSWSGASGVGRDGKALSPTSKLLTASIAKTVTAAEVLRLVDEGRLGLDDPITDHLSRKAVNAFDANGATIRDVLGMRSGISDPPDYFDLVDAGATPTEVLKHTSGPSFEAGSTISYQNINFVLLAMVIEHVTGESFGNALRSGVLDGPGPGGLAYPEKGALAGDGWQVETDPGTLARSGYELYGGSVLSEASLRAMTDFRGDWYGLGAIDFTNGTPSLSAFGGPAIGHGGEDVGVATMMVAFPETDEVVAVQAHGGSLNTARDLALALSDAVGEG
jgi:CubicO group peptidase (beta-lactamase class C family)